MQAAAAMVQSRKAAQRESFRKLGYTSEIGWWFMAGAEYAWPRLGAIT